MLYTAFCETACDEINGIYVTYGIACTGVVLHDVTTSAAYALAIASALTQGEVAACHALCIVEDILAGQAV